jgi:hypothetical protein
MHLDDMNDFWDHEALASVPGGVDTALQGRICSRLFHEAYAYTHT